MAVLTSQGWNSFQFGGQRSYATLVDDFITEQSIQLNSNILNKTAEKPEWETPMKDPFYPGFHPKPPNFLFQTVPKILSFKNEFLRLSFE